MTIKQTFLATKKVIFVASLGNLLEMYAFSLFVMLLPTLTPLFFPFSNPVAALLLAYGVFSLGFLAAPLGALLFGYIGDKYGRKMALSLSLYGMALSTFFIGLLPSFETLGIIAPLFLSCLCFVQGVCLGGENVGGGVYVIESISDKDHGFFGSLTAASGTLGGLFASVLSVFFVSSLMPAWGWRIPFVLAIFIGILGLYLRNSLEESPAFKRVSLVPSFNPIRELLSDKLLPFLCAIGIGGLGTVPFYLIIGFLNSYLVLLNLITISDSAHLNFALLLFSVCTMPLAGYLADKIGAANIMYLSALGSIAFAYPFFCMVYAGSFLNIMLAEIIFLGLSQLFVAPINAFVTQLFPPRSRYTGTALGYCIGMALFGGTTPFVSLSLINWSGSHFAPIFYLIFVCLVGMVSVKVGKKYGTHS